MASLLHLKLQRVKGYEHELPFLNGKLSLNLLGFQPAFTPGSLCILYYITFSTNIY